LSEIAIRFSTQVFRAENSIRFFGIALDRTSAAETAWEGSASNQPFLGRIGNRTGRVRLLRRGLVESLMSPQFAFIFAPFERQPASAFTSLLSF